MDADYLMQVVKAKDGNVDTVKQYMLSSGMTSSALEHSVPEQLFSTADNSAEGISTVKALKIANDQGIPIYTINQTNIATTMPQLQIDQQTKDDITNAVNAGKVVTVSKTNITANGWTGCGYIITNPETGAGAYMISGGTNGGWYVLWWIGYTILLSLKYAGIVASVWLATIVLGPFVLALEEMIVGSFVASAAFLANCVKKAINNNTAAEALRQIFDIPKRISKASDPITLIVSLSIQLLKIWGLTCGQPG
jgi:type III secretion system FlhB-like substrate exporter